MNNNERILVVDDEPANIRLLGELLSAEGYAISVARDGNDALAQIEKLRPSLMLLDVVMPGLSGYEVCQKLREQPQTRLLPVILVTGARPEEERIRGLDAGADDFLTKPVNREELLARVRSLLRVQALHREIAQWNEKLEARVSEQVAQMERLNRLKNFLPQKVAELAVADGGGELLHPRRRQVTVCAIDLRGFTPFTETSEPEEIMGVLGEYYAAMGAVVEQHGGTVERFAGDGMVIFFNAPLEIEKPEEAAVRAALDMQARFEQLRAKWLRNGFDLGLGIGLSSGYATIGALGFSGRWQYAAIGTVTNLSSRLCGDASHGQILATSRIITQVESLVETESLGEKTIKGLQRPVPVFCIVGTKPSPA
ncbi:MAG: response regulator [Pseudomonadota bacterium]